MWVNRDPLMPELWGWARAGPISSNISTTRAMLLCSETLRVSSYQPLNSSVNSTSHTMKVIYHRGYSDSTVVDPRPVPHFLQADPRPLFSKAFPPIGAGHD